tara:strand:+ start:822 stop:1064 length:243 start_codon:yes stop_codon:yes gene_type:complete
MTRTLILHQTDGRLVMADMSKVVAVLDGEFKNRKKDRHFSKLVFQDGGDMLVKETVSQIDVMMSQSNPNSIEQLLENADD